MPPPEPPPASAPRAVLLDFDGPVCSVFAGHPAPAAARMLQEDEAFVAWRADGHPTSDDPMQVLVDAADRGAPQDVLDHLDDLLAAWEVEAVASATPTAGAHELIGELLQRGVPLAVVTNNTAASVVAYRRRFDLPRMPVHGRRRGRPELMKPAPLVVLEACQALGVRPADAVLVGDSVSDVVAGLAAGVQAVGYANRPGKGDLLAAAGAQRVVTTMAEAAALLARPGTR